MSTIIYPSPIFGPVHSRRLGISLGINLLPADGKVCSFDCIYCECGFNEDHRPSLPLPTRESVVQHLGNRYCPKAKVCVLSNSTMIHRQQVHDALMKVDDNILKLDTIDPEYIKKVDHPNGTYDVNQIIERMKAFNGHIIIQTMFMRGSVQCSMFNVQWSMVNGQCSMESVDNTGEEYVGPWLEAIKQIKPQQVMVYTIDRETPAKGLEKASREQLDAIRDRVIAAGIPCTASY